MSKTWSDNLSDLVLDWANGKLTINELATEAYAYGFNDGQQVE